MLTVFGVIAAASMVVAYGLEERDPRWIVVFAVGCAATALYGALTGAWLFAVLETLWAAIAVRRFSSRRSPTGR